MRELGGELDLAQEPRPADRLRKVGPHHLDRDVTIVFEIPRGIDSRHPAAAELAPNDIAAGQRAAQSSRCVVHELAILLSSRGIRGVKVTKAKVAKPFGHFEPI